MTRVSVSALHLRRTWWWILIPFLSFGANNLVPAQLAIEARLSGIVERFLDSYQRRDLAALISYWSEKSPDIESWRLRFQQTFDRNEQISLKSLAIRKLTLDGRRASLRVAIELSAIDVKSGKPAAGFGRMNRTFHFVQEGDEWKLWQYLGTEEDFAQSLLRAATDDERDAMLRAEKELVTVDLVQALIAQGRGLGAQGLYQNALIASELALTLANKLGDKMGAARALYNLGTIYKSQGDYPRALEHYQKLLNVSKEIGDKVGTASSMGSIGQVYSSQRDYPQALTYYENGLKLAEEAGSKPVMATFRNIIGTDYLEQGLYSEARSSYEKGLKLAEEVGDLRNVSSALNNLGIVFDYEGNYSRALEYYQKSLKIKEGLGDKAGMARLLNNLGLIHRLQGNFEQSLTHLEAGLKLREGVAEAKEEIPRALSNIGAVYAAQGNYTQAMAYQQKSLALAETLPDKAILAQTLGNLGVLCGLQGRYSAALEYFQRNLKLNQTLGDQGAVATCLNNLGELHYSQGDYVLAAEMAEQAAALAKQIDLAEVVCAANTTAGQAYHATNQPARSRQSFLTAVDAIEELRGQAGGGEQERQRSFEKRLAAYKGMVDLLVGQNNLQEALFYAERAKGRVLLDVLQDGRINLTKAMTDDERRQEREVRAETVSLNLALQRERMRRPANEAQVREVEELLNKKRLEYEALQTGLYAAHPELKVRRGRMHPLTMDEIVRLMPDARTSLLEFVIQDEKSFLFVITNKSKIAQPVVDLRVYPLDIKKQRLAELTQRFHRSVAERRLNLEELATQLYDMLLKPAGDQLKGINALIIVPDDVLWQLPFQALRQSTRRHLIEDYAVSYAPSLTVLREMMRQQAVQANRTKGLPTLLAFGNPALGVDAVARAKSMLMDEPLEPLPDAERQVKLLGQLYGPAQSRIYTRHSAHEERFKAEAGAYRVLHLATHGILNNANPMYSQLVLSPSEGNTREDGLLEAWEIMNLDLKADLVVLSACETARGRVGAGEGIIGLSWALFVAGAPAAVVSQWKVEATSSTELILEFHRQIRNNSRRTGVQYDSAVALREAALKLLRSKKYDHPFYWAPFVTIGNGRGVRLLPTN